MSHVPLVPIGSPLSAVLSTEDYLANCELMAARDAILAERRAEVGDGWGQKYVDRVHKKGKLTTRERLDLLADDGAPRTPIGTFVNYGEIFGGKLKSPGAGVWCVFTRVAGRPVLVVANDNTVASGSWWPRTPEKIERAQEMALRLRVPVIYLVDCSGLFLPEQSRTFSGSTGAGKIFKRNAELSAAGIPQIAGVFGDCIAGGGYMPLISDRVIMTEQAYMVIAGAALIKGAKSEQITSLDIGGPEVHVHASGCADVRVPDDETALRWIRRSIERLPSSASDYHRAGVEPAPPRFSSDELAGIVPVDHRVAYDPREVLARLVDGSLFWELWPDQGHEVVVGVARIGGLYVGVMLNDPRLIPHPDEPRKRPGGILYKHGIAKLAQFSRACEADGIPLIWVQDISGFDIGEDAERLGLLSYGSSLIYANSLQRAPFCTVLLRRASGAGYYAMAGRPYDPVLQISTPLSRLSVMEGRTLAIASFRTKLDDDFEIATQDPEERADIQTRMKEVEDRIEGDMDPYASACRLDTDEIVTIKELRATLVEFVELTYQATGHRTVKNPRIWSLHDLAALAPAAVKTLACRVGVSSDADETTSIVSPAVGVVTGLPPQGTPVVPGMPLGRLERVGGAVTLLAPQGVAGVVCAAPLQGPVGFGQALLRIQPMDGALPMPVASAEELSTDLVVRAPQAGRFYHRPSPDRPIYVEAGDELKRGQTLGLIEVMKTFFQVRLGDPDTGAGLPERVRVVRHLVKHGADVAQGQPLLELEAL
jgi:3-methylcrotonyl-CoA carboxylase beta subunit